MNSYVRGVNWVGTATVGEFRAGELESKLIGTGLEVDERFEVGAADGPADRRKVVVESRDRHRPVESLLGGVGNGSIHKENLLIHPHILRDVGQLRSIWRHREVLFAVYGGCTQARHARHAKSAGTR